jgi:integrase/recombinase XerC
MTETFFKYLQFEKRLSRNTLSAYQNDIGQFSSFLKEIYEIASPSDASYSMIRSWIIQLSENGVKPVSVNRKIAALRAFYKFLSVQGTISTDPSTKVSVLKSSKRLPSFVREKEIGLMLDSNNPAKDDFECTRDKLIMELFYSTGMRLSELLGLKDHSFNTAACTVKVLGKRSKERIIPFGAYLLPLVQTYLSKRSEIASLASEGSFFVTSSGAPCYPMLVYRVVKRQMAPTSAERKSPHILRHTYATHLLDRGAEINAVKDLLGHSSLAATQVYTHNSMEKIKKVFNQAHPKA